MTENNLVSIVVCAWHKYARLEEHIPRESKLYKKCSRICDGKPDKESVCEEYHGIITEKKAEDKS